jgi:thioredoxin
MDIDSFNEKLREHQNPVVVDFWAPWCGPCKMIKPTLEKLAQEYDGRVDLWEVNADENPDVLKSLHVYGIPTLLVFRNGQETQRYVGAKSSSTLKSLFEALATGEEKLPANLGTTDRLIRLGGGVALAGIWAVTDGHWLLLVMAGALMFSAVYDRCPIWRALTSRFKELTGKA